MDADREREVFWGAYEETNQIPNPAWLRDLQSNKEDYYRTYHIPKRELAKKIAAGYVPPYSRRRIPRDQQHLWREISAPVDQLALLQDEVKQALYKRRPSKFDCCVRGKNRFIANEVMAGKRIIIAMDIQDAFPSTNERMIRGALSKEHFSQQEISRIITIGTKGRSLPQGSPCSPALLNLCRKRLDYRLEGFVRKHHGGTMSVYVDNFYFASNDPAMHKSIPILKNIIRTCGYTAHPKKIYIMRRGGRQGGLGLVASVREDGTVCVQPPREYRNRLRAILHNGVKRKRDGEQPWGDLSVDRVRGMIENCKGSLHYPRFRSQLDEILGKEQV